MSAPTPFLLLNGDVPLAATVHRGGSDPDDVVTPRPAVLVAGSWLTVREQMADRYAAALAARGWTAVTIDFSGFGASGGTLRQAEIPARKVADLVAAARGLRTASFVSGLGFLGVCAGAQYGLRAIAEGAPIESFVSVAGWFHDAATVEPLYGGAPGVRDRLVRATTALETWWRTGEVVTVPAYDPEDERAGMPFPVDYYGNPARGAVPTWHNAMAELSWAHWLTYDGLSPAAEVTAPAMLVHGDRCVLPDNARAVAGSLAGPAEIVWTEGEQTDFYDRDAEVARAVDAADTHFAATLPRTPSRSGRA